MGRLFENLEYLYVASGDFARDLAYYRDVLRAELVWNHEGFGAHVAALRLGEGPLLLLSDHRPAPSCILLYAVVDLRETAKELRKRGWKPEGRPFEIPNGPCTVFEDPSGSESFRTYDRVPSRNLTPGSPRPLLPGRPTPAGYAMDISI